jgi:hypothetical protein
MAVAEALSAPLVAKLNTILLNLGEDAIGEEAKKRDEIKPASRRSATLFGSADTKQRNQR